MSLTNGDLYSIFLYVLNKESLSGYARPEDFGLQLKKNNVLLLRELLGLSNDYGILQYLSKQQKGYSTLLDDKTNIFKKEIPLTFSGGYADIPADYFNYDGLMVDDAYDGVEILFSGEVAHRINNPIDSPTAEFPIATFVGSKIKMYPSTITSADLTYYANPTEPIFDYYIDVNGNIQYLDAGETYTLQAGEIGSGGETTGDVESASVELTWRDTEKIDILWMILKDAGINVLRSDITQYASVEQQMGK